MDKVGTVSGRCCAAGTVTAIMVAALQVQLWAGLGFTTRR